MITKIKYIICAISVICGSVACTDYSDYNSVPADATMPGADHTLWENISNDKQLSKFADLASKCNFSEVLNSPRFYTLWAPVDDAISDAEYNRLMASDSATIVKQFMQQHMTEYNYPVSAALDSLTIISLNAKHHPFTQKGFDGYSYSAVNLPSANGLMHKINGLSEFHNNLYENIDYLEGCDSLKKYIQQYDEYYLDVAASVVGPLRDGKQTYLDSVMRKRNNVIREIMRADLEDEDSTFCMLLPNNKAWEDAYVNILPNYHYIAKMDYLDLSKKTSSAADTKAATAKADKAVEIDKPAELQDSITRRNIVRNLVFSDTNPRNAAFFNHGALTPEDSVSSTTTSYLQNAQTVIEHTIATNELSNGITRTIDSLTLNSWDTYVRPIVMSSPTHTLKVRKLTTHNIPLDSLVDRRDTLFNKVPKMFEKWLFPPTSRFFTYVGVDSADVEGSTAIPEFDFALRDVCSATYHIYVITVPEQLNNKDAAVKPYYLRFYLSWTDADNKQQYTTLAPNPKTPKATEITTDNGTSGSSTIYLGDPGRVNVIDLGEFTFPACYYGQDAYPSLMMSHTKKYTTTANRRKYDQQMRIAGVFLIPKEYDDFWKKTDNE